MLFAFPKSAYQFLLKPKLLAAGQGQLIDFSKKL